MQITLVLCDLIIAAYQAGLESTWHTTIADIHSGKTFAVELNSAQIGAICALALGGDEDALKEDLYNQLNLIAAPALEGCPKECWPIP